MWWVMETSISSKFPGDADAVNPDFENYHAEGLKSFSKLHWRFETFFLFLKLHSVTGSIMLAHTY